ncbi:MAG: hypothetical protein ACI88H_000593 [Cocleimonas sp.]|jgi:hypothetical protein
MKTILSVLIVTALLSSSVNADQKKGKRGPNIDQVVASLQLEDAAASSLKTLMESHRTDRQTLRQQGKKDREQRQVLRAQHRQALLEVLGYEKMYEFEEIMRKNRSERRKSKKQ